MPSLWATLGLQAGQFYSELNNAQAKSRGAGDRISSALGDAITSKVMQFASVAAVEAAISKTVQYADKIDELSTSLGISTDDLQRWDYALAQNGSNLDAGVKFFQQLAVSKSKAFAGDDGRINALKQFGITLSDLGRLNASEMAMRISEVIASAPDPQAYYAALREIGGRGALEMVTAMRSGLAEAFNAAPIISKENIEILAQMADEWEGLKSTGQAFLATVLGPMIKAMVTMREQARELTTVFMEFFGGLLGGKGVKDSFATAMQARADYIADRGKSWAKDKAGAPGGAMAEEDEKEIAKKAKQHNAELDKISKLKKDNAKKAADNALANMSDEEKLVELTKRRDLALLRAGRSTDEENRLEFQGEALGYEKDIDALKRKGAGASKGMPAFDANSLQRIGAYAATNPADSANIKAEQHLADIRIAIREIQKNGKGGSGTAF